MRDEEDTSSLLADGMCTCCGEREREGENLSRQTCEEDSISDLRSFRVKKYEAEEGANHSATSPEL